MDQRLFHDSHSAVRHGLQHAQKEIPVLKAVSHGLVISSAALPGCAAEDVGSRAAVVGKKVLYATPLGTDDGIQYAKGMQPGGGGCEGGILTQQPADFPDKGGSKPVVPVQHQYKVGLGMTDSRISGAGYPSVWLAEDGERNGRVGICFYFLQYFNRLFLCGAIVHDYDFFRPDRLLVQGFNGLQKHSFLVKACNHCFHADLFFHDRSPLSCISIRQMPFHTESLPFIKDLGRRMMIFYHSMSRKACSALT